MIALLLIAIAAGCASALMFASIISGALISLLLFYLAPLPLMVAALGWGPLCATIGGIAAAIGLGALFGLPYCIAFVLAIALPAWWLGHLILLGRPASPRITAGNAIRAMRPIAGMVSGRPHPALGGGFRRLTTTAATLLTLGSDAATITGTMRSALTALWNRPRDYARPSAGSMPGENRAVRRGHRRHDDVDAQSLARRQNHRDLGTIAPALARAESAWRCRR